MSRVVSAAMFILEFDSRSDGGPSHVGPFESREEAFDWAYRTLAGPGISGSYCAVPITPPS